FGERRRRHTLNGDVECAEIGLGEIEDLSSGNARIDIQFAEPISLGTAEDVDASDQIARIPQLPPIDEATHGGRYVEHVEEAALPSAREQMADDFGLEVDHRKRRVGELAGLAGVEQEVHRQ